MEYPGSFQNKSVISSFKWVPWYMLLLVKLKGEGRPFLEGASVDLSSKLSLSTLFVRIENNLTVFKANQYILLLNKCPGIFSSWPDWRGEEGLFWEGARRGTESWDYFQEHLVVIRDEKKTLLLQKFETIFSSFALH